MTNIVVIIVTYNGSKYIQKCLGALHIAKSDNVEVLVIDNASVDNTVEMVKKFDCRLVELKENIGFGAANNLGIKMAMEGADVSHILLLNQDAYVQPRFFHNLLNTPLDIQQSLIGCLQLNGKGNQLDVNAELYYLNPDKCPNFLNDVFFKRLKPFYEIEFMNAAAWIVPTRVFELVGGFSPAFFHYGEDYNFVDRLHFWGERMFLSTECIVLHDREHRPQSSYDGFMFRESLRAIVRFSNPLCNSGWLLFLIKEVLKAVLNKKFTLKFKIKYVSILVSVNWMRISQIKASSKVGVSKVFLE